MKFALNLNRCQLTVYIVLACMCLTNSATTWSNFHLVKSADTINQSIVTDIYPETDSNLKCAMTCTHHKSQSFYHINGSSTCYCNNQIDSGIVADNGGSMVYGFLAQPGTESECQEMYAMGFRDDGEYTTIAGKLVHCNLTSLGWIVFQRRVDGSEEFQRTWSEYVAGFGDPSGEFWLGLEELHQLTQSGCELLVYLEAEPNHPVQAKGYARYSNFSVGDTTNFYTLYVDGFSGTVGDSLSFSSGYPFSTYDADHDLSESYNCALKRIGGWWYPGIIINTWLNCQRTNLNSVYLGGHNQLVYGIYWEDPWSHSYSLLRTEMAIRCH